MAYGEASQVKQLAGVKPDDLKFDTDQEFDEWIDERLAEVKDWIDSYCRRDFDAEVIAGDIPEVPTGVIGVSLQMARNLIAITVASRQTPIVRIDDWRVQIADPEVFTDKHRKTLAMYRKPATFEIFRVRSQQEIDEAEESA